MKRKIILSFVLMAIFTVVSLFFSYNIHYLLSRNRALCSVNPIVLIHGLSEPRIRTFFLLCLIASALFIIYMFVMQGYIKYKSDMQWITPDIETPKAEGQGQFGTSRWLEKRALSNAFTVVMIDSSTTYIEDLISHGYDDLKEVDTHDEKI